MKTKADLMNPFPGLRSFRSDEDYLFFGREEQTLELVTRLQRNRFIAVVGTSGRGKSSLVRCGLLSRLQGGGMVEAGAHWEIAVMHPGGDPLRHLAAALLEAGLYDREAEDALPHLLATLGRSQFGLIEAVRQAAIPAKTNFLLVVDQFEEIFRYNEAGKTESEVANDFIAMLREASAQTEVPIYIVTTMRSDFIGDCSRFEGLAEAVNRGEYLIPGLNRDQFKAAIEGPIRVAGGQLAPRLLQRLLNDLGEEQDQLPCLQHALMRTWRVWQGRADAPALDLEDYAQVGKMSQALSLHADEVFSALATDRQRELGAAMFKALTVEGSEKRGIRRPRRLQTLCGTLGVEPAELTPIIDAFRHPEVSFLMPPSDVPLRDTTVIDLSHESLMRVWTRLRDWVDDEAKSVGIFRRLSESGALWRLGKSGFYRDPELSIARAWVDASRPNAVWAEQYEGHFDDAMAFLQASTEAAEEEVRAKEAARQHELEQARALAEAERRRAEEQTAFAARLKWLVRGLGIVAWWRWRRCSSPLPRDGRRRRTRSSHNKMKRVRLSTRASRPWKKCAPTRRPKNFAAKSTRCNCSGPTARSGSWTAKHAPTCRNAKRHFETGNGGGWIIGRIIVSPLFSPSTEACPRYISARTGASFLPRVLLSTVSRFGMP